MKPSPGPAQCAFFPANPVACTVYLYSPA